MAARYVPANFVAGDFYDVFRLDDDRLGLVVADVAGKGIGASLITASVKAMTPLIAADHDLIETVHQLNDKLCGALGRREFVAFSIAILQLSSGALEVANCGLPPTGSPKIARQRSSTYPDHDCRWECAAMSSTRAASCSFRRATASCSSPTGCPKPSRHRANLSDTGP